MEDFDKKLVFIENVFYKGTRYAFLAMKIFLVFVLSKYRVVECEKTNKGDMELDPHAIFAIKGGVWAKLEARNN